jgi:REP element-mobilizing transposase RayT
MPRKPLFRTNTLPYHITARTNNREDFHVDLGTMWNIVESECRSISFKFGTEIHGLVLMPNHIHMLLTAPNEDLGVVMNLFMSDITRISNLFSGRSGHLFGGPYHWTVVNSTRYFGHVLKYVYRNPVKANLCEKVEDYPYSTLHGLLGRSHLPFPIHYTRVGLELALPYDEPGYWLDWLNRPFPAEAEDAIKAGLRKRVFERILTGPSKKSHDLLQQFL